MKIPLLDRTDDGWLLAPPALHLSEERGRYAPFLLLIAWYLFALLEMKIPGGDPTHAVALAVAIAIAIPWNIWLTRLGPGKRVRFTREGLTLLIRAQWSPRVIEEQIIKELARVQLLTLAMGEMRFVREVRVSAEDWTVAFKISAPLRLEDTEAFIVWLEECGYHIEVAESASNRR